MKSKLLYILYNSDLFATRFLLGLAEFFWAISLLWIGDTFGRPTYHGMQAVMSEEAWAILFLFTGCTQWWLLLNNEYNTRRAVIFAFFNTALWTFCVVSMYLSVYPPPAAISGETALVIGASWIFIRSGWPVKNLHRRIVDKEAI